jgi:hypothetical protein
MTKLSLSWKHALLFIVAVPVVTQFSAWLGRSSGDYVNQRESRNAPGVAASHDIRVVASSQDAEGITAANLDLAVLKNLEAYTVERTRLKTRESLASQGQDDANLDLVSEANYVESGTAKVAVIRMRWSDRSNKKDIANQVLIAGVVGAELKRVACVRETPESIPVSYGPCAEKVQEVFGIKFGG